MLEIFSETWSSFVDELDMRLLKEWCCDYDALLKDRIYGRLHICRAVLFAECMARYNSKVLKIKINPESVRYAAAFFELPRQQGDEKKHIEEVLQETNGNKKLAAKILGISLASLYRKIDDLEIKKK